MSILCRRSSSLRSSPTASRETQISNDFGDPVLPIDAKMIAVARGVQMAGILLCVMDGRNLGQCECFVDLARAETEERVKQILMAAMSDWVNLARFQPRDTQAVR